VVFPPLPTFMSKPLPVSVVAEYHAAVVEAVDVPIIAFQTANAGYPVGTIRALADLGGVVAIKDAAFDIDRTWEIVEEARETEGRVAVLTGNDTFVLEAMLMGCEGALIGWRGPSPLNSSGCRSSPLRAKPPKPMRSGTNWGRSRACAGLTRCAIIAPA